MITLDNKGGMNPLDPEFRDWGLFFLFMLDRFPEIDPVSFEMHIDWIGAREFKPNDWLGLEGTRWRTIWGMPEPSAEFKQWWANFWSQYGAMPTEELSKELEAILIDRGVVA